MINLNEGDRVRAKDLSWGNLEVPQPAWESWWIRSRHLPPCVPSGGLWSLKYTLSSILRVSDDYFARWWRLQSMRISPSPCWQSRFPISCLGLLLLFVYHILIEFRKRSYTTNAMMAVCISELFNTYSSKVLLRALFRPACLYRLV